MWDVPVYVHPAELPFVTGQSSYPPPDPTVGGGFMAWSSFIYPKHPIDLGARVRTIGRGGRAAGVAGLARRAHARPYARATSRSSAMKTAC